MSAIRMNLVGSKSSGQAPERQSIETLPTEDNPLAWVALVVAIISAAVIFLWHVPASPPEMMWQIDRGEWGGAQ